jgi:hypothetical protein
MLQLAFFGKSVVLDEEIPNHPSNCKTGPKKFTEESPLHTFRPNASANPILDFSRSSAEVIKCRSFHLFGLKARGFVGSRLGDR